MEEAIHRFVRLLRLSGLRIGVSEAVDAMRATGAPGIAADRELTRTALRVSLVKDRRDEVTFDWVFDRFFGLLPARGRDAGDDHGHGHDDLSDTGQLKTFSLSETAGGQPETGHSHGPPADLTRYFDEDQLTARYNLHQEANRLDMSSLTDEIVLSADSATDPAAAARLQLTVSRLHNPGRPGNLADADGLRLDTELSVAEEMALLSWLAEEPGLPQSGSGDALGPDELAALRHRLSGLIERLPQALRCHVEALLAGNMPVESPGLAAPRAQPDGPVERERAALEEAVRRLLRSLRGAPRPRRVIAVRGTVDGARTMRSNMRFDGVPFLPVMVARVADRPHLVVLADVSLSVRAAARFTLGLVHELQSLAVKVRSFVFVADIAEVTDLFAERPVQDALGLVMAGERAGGPLNVDADSDYGSVFESFLAEHGTSVNRKTTLLVLGDGRGNGNDPGFGAFEELARRAAETIWITPEPRHSWVLGSCDLPGYAANCDRVYVAGDLRGLERVTATLGDDPAR